MPFSPTFCRIKSFAQFKKSISKNKFGNYGKKLFLDLYLLIGLNKLERLVLDTKVKAKYFFATAPFQPMFIERYVSYSTLFTFLVMWHTCAVSFPLSDIILAQLPYPLMISFFVYIGSK
jgi:hypothetical protein